MKTVIARSTAVALASLAVAACCTLSSCIVNVDKNTERTGRYVSAATLEQIVPGRSPEYVRALLGEPNTKTVVDDSTEIWKWTYSETKRSGGRLIFVYSGDSTESVEGTTYVEFQDGVVHKTWQD